MFISIKEIRHDIDTPNLQRTVSKSSAKHRPGNCSSGKQVKEIESNCQDLTKLQFPQLLEDHNSLHGLKLIKH